ncbi:hypothetical protein [Konateibacter massiliensis]|uniref:hypothetical protein n=1 Tax=Konateibacter massiliensis TaxID=2002841 RepID=UPI000C14C8C4|nr:hypothetical protein [Konateibacter massiliensis]
MLCKLRGFNQNAKYLGGAIVIGLLLAVFGIVRALYLPETAHAETRLMGMLTGFGSAIAAVSAIRLFTQKHSSPEKLKEKEISAKDERNVQILRIAYTISNIATGIMLAGMVFIFSMMGSITESYIALAVLLLQSGIFLAARFYYSKKM